MTIISNIAIISTCVLQNPKFYKNFSEGREGENVTIIA